MHHHSAKVARSSAVSFVVLIILAMTTDALAGVEIIEVPYSWTLQTVGNPFANVSIENNGPIGNGEADSDTLAGEFIIAFNHTPPEFFCEQLDPLPTAVTLNVTAQWDGMMVNTTLDIPGFFDAFIKATAMITAPAGFPAFADVELEGFGTRDIDQQRTTAILVGAGSVPFSGYLDMDSLFGFGGEDLDFMVGSASLEISGALINPNGVIRYTVPGPGAISLLAIAGLVARPRRRRGRQNGQ